MTRARVSLGFRHWGIELALIDYLIWTQIHSVITHYRLNLNDIRLQRSELIDLVDMDVMDLIRKGLLIKQLDMRVKNDLTLVDASTYGLGMECVLAGGSTSC